MWLARSASNETGATAQTYAQHINGVLSIARHALSHFAHTLDCGRREMITAAVSNAAQFHDLGKLDSENQKVLGGESKARRLPYVHSDAGVKHLLDNEMSFSAIAVFSHHVGLPSFMYEAESKKPFRVSDDENETSVRTDSELTEYLSRHAESFGVANKLDQNETIAEIGNDEYAVFMRLVLSLLVEGDHTNSSNHEKLRAEDFVADGPPLRAAERLDALEKHVSGLSDDSDRSKRQTAFFNASVQTTHTTGIVACDSPVGSGKTTAVMAALLRSAIANGYRKIFVVLPFTNIISQSVEVYRKALVLPNENALEVVAEVHHRADFESEDARELATLWGAPIVVTTAVAFFETLAADHPSTLRRLHRIVNSAIFVDEAHAAIPAYLLPVTWRWMNVFAKWYHTHWILASGSLSRYWQIPEIADSCGLTEKNGNVPEMVSSSIRDCLACAESVRIKYTCIDDPIDVQSLIDRVSEAASPRLVILNTVQSAAYVAQRMCEANICGDVCHISTALTPSDRNVMLEKVKYLLANGSDFTLVGTSCIEAGLDFDFASGFREFASLPSLLQCAGRVNRKGKRSDAEVASFALASDPMLKQNPAFDISSEILKSYFQKGMSISDALCTDALQKELRSQVSFAKSEEIVKAEDDLDFPTVAKKYQVIGNNTLLAVVGEELVEKLKIHSVKDWREIQMNSVSVRIEQKDKLALCEVPGYDGLYAWTLEYDSFLGIMKGVLKVAEVVNGDVAIL